jgi:hypothetical protein
LRSVFQVSHEESQSGRGGTEVTIPSTYTALCILAYAICHSVGKCPSCPAIASLKEGARDTDKKVLDFCFAHTQRPAQSAAPPFLHTLNLQPSSQPPTRSPRPLQRRSRPSLFLHIPPVHALEDETCWLVLRRNLLGWYREINIALFFSFFQTNEVSHPISLVSRCAFPSSTLLSPVVQFPNCCWYPKLTMLITPPAGVFVGRQFSFCTNLPQLVITSTTRHCS